MPSIFTAEEVIDPGREFSCHTVEQDQAWSFERHQHKGFYDLSYVHHGSIRHEVNGTRITLDEGTLILIRDGDEHRLRAKRVVMYNLNFRTAALRNAARYLGLEDRLEAVLAHPDPPTFRASASRRASLLIEFQNLLYTQHRPDAAGQFRAFLVRWVLGYLDGPAHSGPDVRPAWISDLEQYIEDNVERSLTVSSLAERAGRSSEHLARSFRRYLGTTPSSAINRARLNRAALLLAHTNRPILDICFGMGYNSASYFYRLFGSAHGMSPRRYRMEKSVLLAPGGR